MSFYWVPEVVVVRLDLTCLVLILVSPKMDIIFTLSLIAVGVVLLLCWCFCMRVVDTPTFCTMCEICYLRADDCAFAPRAIRWYRPHQIADVEMCRSAWVCNVCIYTPLKETSPGSMARVLAGCMSWLAHSSNFWWIAKVLRVLTIPSCVVTGGNVHKSALERSDDKTSAVTSAPTPPPARSARRAASPAIKITGDSKSTREKAK